MAAGKGAGKKYRTFFVANNITQYFISPIEYKLKKEKMKFLIDYTFRDSTQSISAVTANYSLISSTPVKEISAVAIQAGGETIQLTNLNRLFIEKVKKEYIVRYSARLTYPELQKIFASDAVTYQLSTENGTLEIGPGKKPQKTISFVNEEMLELLELNRSLRQ